jgi:hypothetical protein
MHSTATKSLFLNYNNKIFKDLEKNYRRHSESSVLIFIISRDCLFKLAYTVEKLRNYCWKRSSGGNSLT